MSIFTSLSGIIRDGGIRDGGILHGGNPNGRFLNGGKHIIKCNKVFISVLFVSMCCLSCHVRLAGLPREYQQPAGVQTVKMLI